VRLGRGGRERVEFCNNAKRSNTNFASSNGAPAKPIAYFKSEEGQKEYAEWIKKRKKDQAAAKAGKSE
jgi:hypothetical protein